MAKSTEEYEKWQTFVESGGHKLIEEDIYEDIGGGEPETPVPPVAPAAPVAAIKVEDADKPTEDEVYEDPDSAPPPVPALPPTPKSSLPPPPPPPVTRSPVTTPRSPKNPEPEAAPVIEDTDEIYDDAMSEETKPTPPVPSRNLPPAPEIPPPTVPSRPKRGLPELPPTPVSKKKVKINITCKPEEDFENKFYGKWDCTGDNASELSFKRGDMIHILSREFDEKSWWIGELNGKFGLVPKTFLVPAYTLVTQ